MNTLIGQSIDAILDLDDYVKQLEAENQNLADQIVDLVDELDYLRSNEPHTEVVEDGEEDDRA